MKLARNLERAATLEFCAALRQTFAEKGGRVPGSVAVVGVYLEAARSTGEEHDELTFVASLADAQLGAASTTAAVYTNRPDRAPKSLSKIDSA